MRLASRSPESRPSMKDMPASRSEPVLFDGGGGGADDVQKQRSSKHAAQRAKICFFQM